MRKIYGFFLILLLAPAILFVCVFVYSYFSERSKTWFCKDINMRITIVDKHSDYDMIILNNSDSIFTSSDLGRTLCGVELHFKEHNDTVYIVNSHLEISNIKAHKYRIFSINDNQKKGFRIPAIYNSDDITICGDPDSWDFYALKNGKSSNILEVVN